MLQQESVTSNGITQEGQELAGVFHKMRRLSRQRERRG